MIGYGLILYSRFSYIVGTPVKYLCIIFDNIQISIAILAMLHNYCSGSMTLRLSMASESGPPSQ